MKRHRVGLRIGVKNFPKDATVKRVQIGPTGAVIWKAKGAAPGWHSFFWNGPGSRLKLMFGDQLLTIDPPSADDVYYTEK